MKEKHYLKVVMLFLACALIFSCASGKKKTDFQPQDVPAMEAGEDIVPSEAGKDIAPSESPRISEGVTSEKYMATPGTTESWISKPVDDFLVVLDASGSKYLPHSRQVKLKIAKDVLREMNKYIPDRPLTGGIRRYGYEAGAWSTRSEIIYGMTSYYQDDFARAIEIIRWAGGKSGMEEAFDAGTQDLMVTTGQIAVIVVSDGIIKDNDPVAAAKRMKSQYGDRICIYTVQVGNDAYGANLLDKVVVAGGCGFAETADFILSSPEEMAKWVDDVFNGKRRAPKVALTQPRAPRALAAAPKPWVNAMVNFDLNKHIIKPQYFGILDRIAAYLVNHPETRLEVQGHTCNIWTEDYNMTLSHQRAIAVMNYLIKKGVQPHQLSVKGYGLGVPAASNKTDNGRSMNRRAEFREIQ